MNTKSPVKPSPLGRGLSALFGDTDGAYKPRTVPGGGAVKAAPSVAAAIVAAASTPEKTGVSKIPIEWLQPGAYQPRRRFDEEPLSELADSIRERGVLQPLLVRPLPGEKETYEIVAGERRWRASQLAGIHEVPVVVREMTDREAMEIGLIENVQREGLSLLEEAEGYKRLIDEFSYTHDALSKVVGKSRSHMTNLIRLLNLPDSVRSSLDQGALTVGHARVIVASRFPEEMAKEIIRRGLNVRQAEAVLKREVENRKPGLKAKAAKVAVENQADILSLEKELSKATGLKVKIQDQGNKGSLTLYYQDLDQLDEIIKRLR